MSTFPDLRLEIPPKLGWSATHPPPNPTFISSLLSFLCSGYPNRSVLTRPTELPTTTTFRPPPSAFFQILQTLCPASILPLGTVVGPHHLLWDFLLNFNTGLDASLCSHGNLCPSVHQSTSHNCTVNLSLSLPSNWSMVSKGRLRENSPRENRENGHPEQALYEAQVDMLFSDVRIC